MFFSFRWNVTFFWAEIGIWEANYRSTVFVFPFLLLKKSRGGFNHYRIQLIGNIVFFWLSIINSESTRFKNKAHKSWNVRWLVALKSIFIWAPLPICNIICILLSIWSKPCLRCFARMMEISIDRLVGTISSLCSLGHSRHQKQIWSCKACEIIFLFFYTQPPDCGMLWSVSGRGWTLQVQWHTFTVSQWSGCVSSLQGSQCICCARRSKWYIKL